MGIWIVACPAALAIAPASAFSQTIVPASLHLGDLYGQVQRSNPRVAAARSLTRAAQARVPGASRPPDPNFQIGFMNYALPRLAPMPTLGMTQLQLMQMFPLGGKLSLAGRAASAQAAATAFRAEDVSWELRNQTAMAFYDLYTTERGLDVARETLQLLQDIAATAEAMYRVGDGRQTDVLRARVEIARMAEDTLRMQAMRQSMTARLDALLDRDPSAEIGAPVLPEFPDSIPTRAWLDSVARDTRPMIRAGLDDLRAADASAQLARKEIVPDLQVGVQYAQRGGEMGGGTERMGSLMLGASLPIFARSRQFQMRVEADAMRQMAQADLAAMRAETRGKIGEAYAALTRARGLAQLYRTTVLPQAEATVASALAAYRVGSVDFMTLLDDRMTVNKYRQELYALDADQGKAWAELEMLVGLALFDANNLTSSVAATARPTSGSER
jgi:outer membrane protein, heavy metal efflux system